MKTTPLLHHKLDSNYANWAKYDAETKTLYLAFPGGSVYAYDDVPLHVFGNLKTAKDSTAEPTETTRGPIGGEKPGSEGSYLIHHVVGRNRKEPPYTFRKLSGEEEESLHAEV